MIIQTRRGELPPCEATGETSACRLDFFCERIALGFASDVLYVQRSRKPDQTADEVRRMVVADSGHSSASMNPAQPTNSRRMGGDEGLVPAGMCAFNRALINSLASTARNQAERNRSFR